MFRKPLNNKKSCELVEIKTFDRGKGEGGADKFFPPSSPSYI